MSSLEGTKTKENLEVAYREKIRNTLSLCVLRGAGEKGRV